MLMPRWVSRMWRSQILAQFDTLPQSEQEAITDRVNYYCRLQPKGATSQLPQSAKRLGDHNLRAPRKYASVYFYDTAKYTRCFDPQLRWDYRMGDVTTVPSTPSIVKSRPLCSDNQNSVMLKLNKVRHYIFVKDTIPFEQKRDMAVFRGSVKHKPNRIDFVARFYNHPLCDAGETYSNIETLPAESKKPPISVLEHLQYKFIMALEGVDVASNLKWVMSSNSVAVMPRPTCETWFMEGRLIPNHHYIEVAPDFSDFEERIEYYLDHPEEAKQIARNANAYVAQFRDQVREEIISLMVMQRYFEMTRQL